MRALQRPLDLLLVLCSAPLWLPLMGCVAAAILMSGGRPMLHAQLRLGRDQRPFRMHKFRTLVVEHTPGATVAPDGDPRITPAGGFLRKWRLDELAQLFDVLRGAMSVVGPRPERPEHLQAVPEEIRRRVYSVRPGLTGPASVAFLAEDEYLAGVPDPVSTYCRVLLPAKLRMELDYLERWSLPGDLRIIARTARCLFSPAARRRSRHMIEQLAATGDR